MEDGDGRAVETTSRQVGELARRIVANVASVVRGKDEVIEACVVTLLAEGHLMLEDFPGVGKTLLAKALARSVDCRFAASSSPPTFCRAT